MRNFGHIGPTSRHTCAAPSERRNEEPRGQCHSPNLSWQLRLTRVSGAHRLIRVLRLKSHSCLCLCLTSTYASTLASSSEPGAAFGSEEEPGSALVGVRIP